MISNEYFQYQFLELIKHEIWFRIYQLSSTWTYYKISNNNSIAYFLVAMKVLYDDATFQFLLIFNKAQT